MPEWLILILVTAGVCALVVAVTLLNQRRVPEDDDPSETPDVIEYMTMMIGVVYAIVLGLAIAGVWEARGAAQDGVRTEAQALHEVSERAAGYPAPVRDRIRADVRAYADHVVSKEWQVMIDKGELTDRGATLLAELRRDVADYTPRTELEWHIYQPLVDQVAAVDAAREARAQNAGPTMPRVVWFGLAVGAALVVGLLFTLQIRRTPRELAMSAMFCALMVFLLFLVWDFDAPFGRSVGDTADPFRDLFPS
ncbi:bestrophin-like domain [Streptomyces sp. NPDC000941]